MPQPQGKHAYFDDDDGNTSSTPPSSRPSLHLYTSNMPSRNNSFETAAMCFFTPDANAQWSWSARSSSEQGGAATAPRSLALVPSVPPSVALLVPPPVPTGPPLPVPRVQSARPPRDSHPARTPREAQPPLARTPRQPREPRAPRTSRPPRPPRPPRKARTPRPPRNGHRAPSLRFIPYEPIRFRFSPRSPSAATSCTLSDSDYSPLDDNVDEYGRSYAYYRRQQEIERERGTYLPEFDSGVSWRTRLAEDQPGPPPTVPQLGLFDRPRSAAPSPDSEVGLGGQPALQSRRVSEGEEEEEDVGVKPTGSLL